MESIMQLFPFSINSCERWMDESRNWLSRRLAAVNSEVAYWDVCLESGEEGIMAVGSTRLEGLLVHRAIHDPIASSDFWPSSWMGRRFSCAHHRLKEQEPRRFPRLVLSPTSA